MNKLLPRIVYQMCVHGALLVGSYARYIYNDFILENEDEPKDFDLLVPLEHWQKIAMLIPTNAQPNKFGGWRFLTADVPKLMEVDIWPDTLMNYLTNCKSSKHTPVIALDFIHNRVYKSEFIDI